MSKNRPHTNERHENRKRNEGREHGEYGFVYLVKSPVSNDITVCASETKLKKQDKVIYPSRFGLDFGVVIGSTSMLGQYQPGSTEGHGAQLHGDAPETGFSPDDDLLASSEELGIEIEHSDPLSEVDEVTEESLSLQPQETDAQVKDPALVKVSGDIDWIERIADEEDIERFSLLEAQETEALILCREKIVQHKLDMKLVSAHYLFGEPKIVFFFTSANRVDFRDLVRDLVAVFKIRIELRQIGVRDESRVLGGLAVCGRDYCCHCLSDKLNPVSIKMAKEQNLSLNSTKISGPCGRLLCCLSYEYNFYVEEKKSFPPEGGRLRVLGETMRISEVNILSRKITLTSPDGRRLSIPAEEIRFDNSAKRWEVNQQYVEEILST